MTGDKFRFRFRKSGTLRLVSHHDLMRCTERMLRRAAIPFKSTAGFHPTPRLVFALSLPLGVVGGDEVVELELTAPRDSEDVLAALNAQAPSGLTFTRVAVVPMKSTARVRRVVYRLPIPPDLAAEVEEAARALLAQPKVWVERLRPSPKRLNIRPYLRAVGVEDSSKDPTPLAALAAPPGPVPGPVSGASRGPGQGEGQKAGSLTPPSFPGKGAGGLGPSSHLLFDLWVTQEGTARADELLRLLNVADLLEDGAVLERTAVEIRDEITATHPLDVPPDGPSDSIPLSGTEVAALAARLDEEASQQAPDWGLSPNGPVVE